jgi:SAM-dependent methyltransferase
LALRVSLIIFIIGQLLLLASRYLINVCYYNSKYKTNIRESFFLVCWNLKLLLQKGKKIYFTGLPYQSLEHPLIFGDRPTFKRLEEYGILSSISKEHRVLDLGCAEGFLGITIFRLTGATVLNVDHNQQAVRQGLNLVRVLNLTGVRYFVSDIRSFSSKSLFDRILAMAAYKTDDGGIHMNLQEYLFTISKLLKKNGLIYFESHWETQKFETHFVSTVSILGLVVKELKWVDSGNRLFAVIAKP